MRASLAGKNACKSRKRSLGKPTQSANEVNNRQNVL